MSDPQVSIQQVREAWELLNEDYKARTLGEIKADLIGRFQNPAANAFVVDAVTMAIRSGVHLPGLVSCLPLPSTPPESLVAAVVKWLPGFQRRHPGILGAAVQCEGPQAAGQGGTASNVQWVYREAFRTPPCDQSAAELRKFVQEHVLDAGLSAVSFNSRGVTGEVLIDLADLTFTFMDSEYTWDAVETNRYHIRCDNVSPATG